MAQRRCSTIGISYLGNGVPQNYQQAYAWLAIAVANGNDGALNLRDTVASKLTQSELTQAQSLAASYFEQYQSK